MKRHVAIRASAAVALWCAAVASHAAPLCQTQTQGGHRAKLCIEQTTYQHNYFMLWVDDALLFTLPDDYVETVSLTHTVSEDGAGEFALSKQGTPTVSITGGCRPVQDTQRSGDDEVSVETGRLCAFNWGQQPIVKDMRFRFDAAAH